MGLSQEQIKNIGGTVNANGTWRHGRSDAVWLAAPLRSSQEWSCALPLDVSEAQPKSRRDYSTGVAASRVHVRMPMTVTGSAPGRGMGPCGVKRCRFSPSNA